MSAKKKVTDWDVVEAIRRHPEYPRWLREAASKGGKTSKRKLPKREARRIASLGWEGAVGEARRAKLRAKTHNH